jgi:hypothetical protein
MAAQAAIHAILRRSGPPAGSLPDGSPVLQQSFQNNRASRAVVDGRLRGQDAVGEGRPGQRASLKGSRGGTEIDGFAFLAVNATGDTIEIKAGQN